MIPVTKFRRRPDPRGYAGRDHRYGGGEWQPRFSGDGGPATGASLTVSAIAVDGLGDLFIAEAGVPGIRDGTINTIAGGGLCCYGYYSGAGGPATAGKFSWTSGVAVNRTGNVYVADTYNNVVRVLRPIQ
jgi:DNA-binding beta-propeller fold protein YncE